MNMETIKHNTREENPLQNLNQKNKKLKLSRDEYISKSEKLTVVEKLDKSELTELPEILPPEIEEGNIEYKLQLLNPTDSRFQQLVSQMKWRLEEGEGEAFYEIGVADNGTLAGLEEYELQKSLHTLGNMAKQLGATSTIVRQRYISESEPGNTPLREAVEVLVRKIPEDRQVFTYIFFKKIYTKMLCIINNSLSIRYRL